MQSSKSKCQEACAWLCHVRDSSSFTCPIAIYRTGTVYHPPHMGILKLPKSPRRYSTCTQYLEAPHQIRYCHWSDDLHSLKPLPHPHTPRPTHTSCSSGNMREVTRKCDGPLTGRTHADRRAREPSEIVVCPQEPGRYRRISVWELARIHTLGSRGHRDLRVIVGVPFCPIELFSLVNAL